jgi:hypothetical protein
MKYRLKLIEMNDKSQKTYSHKNKTNTLKAKAPKKSFRERKKFFYVFVGFAFTALP